MPPVTLLSYIAAHWRDPLTLGVPVTFGAFGLAVDWLGVFSHPAVVAGLFSGLGTLTVHFFRFWQNRKRQAAAEAERWRESFEMAMKRLEAAHERAQFSAQRENERLERENTYLRTHLNHALTPGTEK